MGWVWSRRILSLLVRDGRGGWGEGWSHRNILLPCWGWGGHGAVEGQCHECRDLQSQGRWGVGALDEDLGFWMRCQSFG